MLVSGLRKVREKQSGNMPDCASRVLALPFATGACGLFTYVGGIWLGSASILLALAGMVPVTFRAAVHPRTKITPDVLERPQDDSSIY
jgi:hypothetical protein